MWVQSIFRAGLDDDPVYFGEANDVGGIDPAVISGNNIQNVRRRDSGPFALCRIHVHHVLHVIHPERTESGHDFRDAGSAH